MAVHDVEMRKVPSLKLGKSDIIFDIKVDGSMLGSLRISKGQAVWRPSGNTYGYWLDWSDVDKIFTSNGKWGKVNF